MDMRDRTVRRTLPALIALVVFLAWLGAGVVHQHPAGPSCQLCKLIHNAPADLVRRAAAPEPNQVFERILPGSSTAITHLDPIIPRGRAPPTT